MLAREILALAENNICTNEPSYKRDNSFSRDRFNTYTKRTAYAACLNYARHFSSRVTFLFTRATNRLKRDNSFSRDRFNTYTKRTA